MQQLQEQLQAAQAAAKESAARAQQLEEDNTALLRVLHMSRYGSHAALQGRPAQGLYCPCGCWNALGSILGVLACLVHCTVLCTQSTSPWCIPTNMTCRS